MQIIGLGLDVRVQDARKESFWTLRGTLKAHLLMNGFMDGYTQWIREEDDDEEDIHMAGNNDMGLDEEMTDRQEDDGAGHVGGEECGNDDGGGEDSGHGEEESGHGGEEAAVTP